jgi:hypothetical protein
MATEALPVAFTTILYLETITYKWAATCSYCCNRLHSLFSAEFSVAAEVLVGVTVVGCILCMIVVAATFVLRLRNVKSQPQTTDEPVSATLIGVQSNVTNLSDRVNNYEQFLFTAAVAPANSPLSVYEPLVTSPEPVTESDLSHLYENVVNLPKRSPRNNSKNKT